MKRLPISLVAFAMLVTRFHAMANTDCPAPPGVTEVALPSGLPGALRDKMGNTAMPGQPFNAIDVCAKGQPSRRYIFVWNIGTRWIVTAEQGGIALRSTLFVYDLNGDGKNAVLVGEHTGLLSEVCSDATRLAER